MKVTARSAAVERGETVCLMLNARIVTGEFCVLRDGTWSTVCCCLSCRVTQHNILVCFGQQNVYWQTTIPLWYMCNVYLRWVIVLTACYWRQYLNFALLATKRFRLLNQNPARTDPGTFLQLILVLFITLTSKSILFYSSGWPSHHFQIGVN